MTRDPALAAAVVLVAAALLLAGIAAVRYRRDRDTRRRQRIMHRLALRWHRRRT